MNIQEMKERKQELGYSNAKIAELSGVPLSTVQKIFSGETTTPRYATLQALEQIFMKRDEYAASTIHETAAPYLTKRQGEYTIADCDKLPDDIRTELIDGVIYYMAAPYAAHQLIAGYVYAKFFQHVLGKSGDCLPMISPLDVELDKDDKTRVQPDVLIVCDRSKVIQRCVYGAPDFVLEVLSKSTRKKDTIIKLNKYMNAGVKEYWMIDSEKKRVMVYNFEVDELPTIYGFDAVIPVTTFAGECEIDFNDLYNYIGFLYE